MYAHTCKKCKSVTFSTLTMGTLDCPNCGGVHSIKEPLVKAIITRLVRISLVYKDKTKEPEMGMLYLSGEDRVQDIANDNRRFLPFNKWKNIHCSKGQEKYALVLVNKDSIETIEEVAD